MARYLSAAWICFILCAWPCHVVHGKGLRCWIIYDFESQRELSGLIYKCHTWFELDRCYATHGSKSLRLEMYPPEEYPGLSLGDLKGPWKNVRQIKLDIYNPEENDITLTMRIDDRDDDPPYGDRINERLLIHPGLNHVVLDLKRLLTSGTGRRLVPRKICAFMIFLTHPRAPVTIFVDNIRLCEEK